MKYILKRIAIGVSVGVIMLFARHAFAASYTFDCSTPTLVYGGATTCSGGTFTWTSPVGYSYDFSPYAFPLNAGQTYYLTATVAGSGALDWGSNDGSSGPVYGHITGSYSEHPFTVTTAGTGGLFFDNRATSGFPGTFNGDVSAICLDDDGFSCGGSPPTPAVPLGGATSTVEQAESNLAMSFVIFFTAFFGTVWLLRPRN